MWEASDNHVFKEAPLEAVDVFLVGEYVKKATYFHLEKKFDLRELASRTK